MRAFIAIKLPKKLCDYLTGLQQELKKTQADVKWVAPNNIHLTLKFLGEIDTGKLDEIIAELKEISKNKTPFNIRPSSLGAFPKITFPRVIWVGIDKGDVETCQIAKDLEGKLVELGIPAEDKKFSSHITVGRVRSNLHRERLVAGLSDLASRKLPENLEFLADKITLLKSTLTPKGPLYEILNETSLKTT